VVWWGWLAGSGWGGRRVGLGALVGGDNQQKKKQTKTPQKKKKFFSFVWVVDLFVGVLKKKFVGGMFGGLVWAGGGWGWGSGGVRFFFGWGVVGGRWGWVCCFGFGGCSVGGGGVVCGVFFWGGLVSFPYLRRFLTIFHFPLFLLRYMFHLGI